MSEQLEWRIDPGTGKSPGEVFGEIRMPKKQSVPEFFRSAWFNMTPEEKTVEAMSWLLPPAKGGGLLAKAAGIGFAGITKEVALKKLLRGLPFLSTPLASKQGAAAIKGLRAIPQKALDAVDDVDFAKSAELSEGVYGRFRPRNNTIKLNPYYKFSRSLSHAGRSATHEVTHSEWWNPRPGTDIRQINFGRLLGNRLDDMVESRYIEPWVAYKLRPSELTARRMASQLKRYSSQGKEVPQELWDTLLKRFTAESTAPAEKFLYRSGDEMAIQDARRMVEELGSMLLK